MEEGTKGMYDTKDREKSFKMLEILRSLSLPAGLLAADGFLRQRESLQSAEYRLVGLLGSIEQFQTCGNTDDPGETQWATKQNKTKHECTKGFTGVKRR